MIRTQFQVNALRRASRKAVIENANNGLISWINHFNRFQLAITCAALVFSVALLFIGTYVQFDPTDQFASTYDTIARLYGIDVHDFTSLLAPHHAVSQHSIGTCMVFVAVISILFEIGLICAVLFNNFRLSLVLAAALAISLVHTVCYSRHIYAGSLTFQVIFLASFCVFTTGIKVKVYVANKILASREKFELGEKKSAMM